MNGRRAALAGAALVGGWLWLLGSMPLRHDGFSPYDGALFLRQAMHLANGDWLGPYDQLTLAKGAGYPLWLALVHRLHLPVMTAAAACHAAACWLCVLALRPLWPTPGLRLALFAALLLSPTALGEWSTQRELVYPAASLLLLGCTLGWLLRLRERGAWRWSFAAGAALAGTALMREELVLLAPLALAVALAIAAAGRPAWRETARGALLLAATAALPLLLVTALNHRHYGVATLVEMNSRPFTSAYGALVRIAHHGAPPQVPVPRESWQRAAAASPAFALTERHLSGDIGRAALGPGIGAVGPLIAANDSVRLWLSRHIGYDIPAGSGTEWFRRSWAEDRRFHDRLARYVGSPAIAEAFLSGAMDNEIAAWRFAWFLRDSAAAAGQFTDAVTAARYWQQVADQINAACDRGVLGCTGERHGLTPPLAAEHLRWWPWGLVIATQALLTLEAHGSSVRMGYLGKPEELAAAAAFLRERLAPPDATLPAVPLVEAWIGLWRWLLPWAAAAALLAWIAAAPWRWRSAEPRQRMLWALGALLLALVALRLAVLSLIHVSSWPAATLPRYLAPAHAPLILFIAAAAALTWRRWRPGRAE